MASRLQKKIMARFWKLSMQIKKSYISKDTYPLILNLKIHYHEHIKHTSGNDGNKATNKKL